MSSSRLQVLNARGFLRVSRALRLLLFQTVLTALQLTMLIPVGCDACASLGKLEEEKRRKRASEFIFVHFLDVEGKRKQTEMNVRVQSASSSDETPIGESVATLPTQHSFAGLVVKGKLGSGASATVLMLSGTGSRLP